MSSPGLEPRNGEKWRGRLVSALNHRNERHKNSVLYLAFFTFYIPLLPVGWLVQQGEFADWKHQIARIVHNLICYCCRLGIQPVLIPLFFWFQIQSALSTYLLLIDALLSAPGAYASITQLLHLVRVN